MEADVDQLLNIHNYMAAWDFLFPISHTHPLSGADSISKQDVFKVEKRESGIVPRGNQL